MKRLFWVLIVVPYFLVGCAAENTDPFVAQDFSADFETSAKKALAEIHADSIARGDIEACVSLYTADAKFFVDNQLQATGRAELIAFYRQLKEEDKVLSIEVDEFVDFSLSENSGWVTFNYSKIYDLTDRDPGFLKQHNLTGFSALRVRQYGTALFRKTDDRWKIQTMLVFDPEIWEPQR